MFDKLKFWKKDEGEFNIDEDVFIDKSVSDQTQMAGQQRQFEQPQQPTPGALQTPFTEQPQRFPEAAPSTQTMGHAMNKDLELINAKLDAIKSALENMNQRMVNLERIAEAENQQTRRIW